MLFPRFPKVFHDGLVFFEGGQNWSSLLEPMCWCSCVACSLGLSSQLSSSELLRSEMVFVFFSACLTLYASWCFFAFASRELGHSWRWCVDTMNRFGSQFCWSVEALRTEFWNGEVFCGPSSKWMNVRTAESRQWTSQTSGSPDMLLQLYHTYDKSLFA